MYQIKANWLTYWKAIFLKGAMNNIYINLMIFLKMSSLHFIVLGIHLLKLKFMNRNYSMSSRKLIPGAQLCLFLTEVVKLRSRNFLKTDCLGNVLKNGFSEFISLVDVNIFLEKFFAEHFNETFNKSLYNILIEF